MLKVRVVQVDTRKEKMVLSLDTTSPLETVIALKRTDPAGAVVQGSCVEVEEAGLLVEFGGQGKIK